MYCYKIKIIGLAFFLGILQSCTRNASINYKYIPVEITKKFAANRNCNCIIYSKVEGYKYKPTILNDINGKLISHDITIKDDDNYNPQSLSFDCSMFSMTVQNKKSGLNRIYLYNIAHKKLFLMPHQQDTVSNSGSAFSPVDNKLAYLANDRLKIYDFKSRYRSNPKQPDTVKFKFVSWSAHGKYLILEDGNTNIWRYNVINEQFKLIWHSATSFGGSRYIITSEGDDESFYFLSDHESEFNQIYSFTDGQAIAYVRSDFDKFLLPEKNGYLYYRSNENGNYILKRVKKGASETIMDKGVVYDFFPHFEDGGIATYADVHHSASVFEIRKGYAKNLLSFIIPDTVPPAVYSKNAAGMFNLIYLPKSKPLGWVVWLHGGPKQQASNRYQIYLAAMIKAGYAVIALNYEGSVGLGNSYDLKYGIPEEVLGKQVQSVEADLSDLLKQYHISSYAIVAESYATQIARPFISGNKDRVSHYIELCGVGATSDNFKIPTLYIYGALDEVMKNEDRSAMIDRQLKNTRAESIVLKNEGHTIINRNNIYQTVNGITEFLSR